MLAAMFSPSYIRKIFSPLAALLALLVASVPLIQRVPNGADHYFMIDVGETQIVLNVWGTLHATGYPHYVMLGNLLTAPLHLLGTEPLVAAALVSLFWGLIAAGLLYGLAHHLTESPVLAALTVVAYNLTRTVWIHNVIAEIYSFGVVLLVGLLALALWRDVSGWRGSPYARIYCLALLGGIAVAHHRALGMVAPALLYAVWPTLTQQPRRIPAVLLKSLALGLLGFLPYAYLVIRARAGAAWVYGEPGTLNGLWAQVSGAEASRFIGPPGTPAALWDNVVTVTGVVFTDVTVAGALLGVLGLALGVRSVRYRRPALTLALSGLVAYGFHIAFYTDILSALILPVTLSLVIGWAFAADLLLRAAWARGVPTVAGHARLAWGGVAIAFALFGGLSATRHAPFIRELVTDPRGLDVIEIADNAPSGSVLMLPWGPAHFAVGYAVDVSGDLGDITLVDHQADYRAAAQDRRLVVPEFVRFRYPPTWWAEQLGGEVFPVAVAPGLVGLRTEPERLTEIPLSIDSLSSQERVTCNGDRIQLDITWLAPVAATRDLSVFTHLLDADGAMLAQDDRFAPVYGWRPVTSWAPGELVHDVYTLPAHPDAVTLRYGAYYTTPDGGFVNEFVQELAVTCDS
jgi:hypothetical protein